MKNQRNHYSADLKALAALPEAFSARRAREAQDEDALRAQLYEQIGQLYQRTKAIYQKPWLSHQNYAA